MAEINFYHLQASGIEQNLPKLMAKVYDSGANALVRCADQTLCLEVDKMLWSYPADSFLPHVTDEVENAADNAIVIASGDKNPNNAKILMMLDGASDNDLDQYDRILFMFDGRHDDTLQAARKRWKTYIDAGHNCTYWQQTESGGWQKKA